MPQIQCKFPIRSKSFSTPYLKYSVERYTSCFEKLSLKISQSPKLVFYVAKKVLHISLFKVFILITRGRREILLLEENIKKWPASGYKIHFPIMWDLFHSTLNTMPFIKPSQDMIVKGTFNSTPHFALSIKITVKNNELCKSHGT